MTSVDEFNRILDSGHFTTPEGLGDTLALDTTHLRGCLKGPFVTLSKGEESGGWGTRRYCQADVDSSTSLRMTFLHPAPVALFGHPLSPAQAADRILQHWK